MTPVTVAFIGKAIFWILVILVLAIIGAVALVGKIFGKD